MRKDGKGREGVMEGKEMAEVGKKEMGKGVEGTG